MRGTTMARAAGLASNFSAVSNKNDLRDPVNAAESGSENGSEDPITPNAQAGLQKVEAMAQVWTRNELIVAYSSILVVFFIRSLQQQTTGNLTPYVTSSFMMHSLVSTIAIVSQIVGGVLTLPIAKLLDMWGRMEGFVVMLASCMIGLAMMAGCNNVKTYAGAQVFYWVGQNGMGYVLDVFMADTSSLKHRALVFAFSTTPYIGTTFAGPALAMSFYNGSTWRWGHGVWCIITPILALPFIMVVWRNQRKSKSLGLINLRVDSGHNWKESINYWFWDFDTIGITLVCAGFVLILLPLSLASYQKDQWKSGNILAMLVVGFLCLAAFGVHERYFAKKSFIPFHLLLDRTIAGACGLSCILFISFYCWDAYYSSYLQVVHNQNIRNAGYISNIYSIGSCFWAVVVAILIRLTGRFKWLALFFGLPLYILSTGLMIHFRQAHTDIGYVIMCQIFISFAGGTLVICEDMAIMAASPHQNVAATLAFLSLFSYLGGGVGSAISGAIWTNTLPKRLAETLPDHLKPMAFQIYSDITVQLDYPWGSPEREAIIAAYSYTQRLMVIAATSATAFGIIFIIIWRDLKVTDVKSTKGRVI